MGVTAPRRAHNSHYEPCAFYALKSNVTAFYFGKVFGNLLSRLAIVSDIVGSEVGQAPLEERVENQALSVDLREAVMACLAGCARRHRKPIN